MTPLALEDLLSQLERITTEAVGAAAGAEKSDFDRAVRLIVQRGELVRQLHDVIAASGPLSYMEFNRMVVVHHQGAQIEAGMKKTRETLQHARAEAERQRAYANCLHRMVAPPVSAAHQIDI